jgi:hypothetical protein
MSLVNASASPPYFFFLPFFLTAGAIQSSSFISSFSSGKLPLANPPRGVPNSPRGVPNPPRGVPNLPRGYPNPRGVPNPPMEKVEGVAPDCDPWATWEYADEWGLTLRLSADWDPKATSSQLPSTSAMKDGRGFVAKSFKDTPVYEAASVSSQRSECDAASVAHEVGGEVKVSVCFELPAIFRA